MSFKKVDSQVKLPEVEEKILDFWTKNKTFEKSLAIRQDAPIFSFYDGPPFATGTPHYGHLVQSVAKDAMPRYFTMKGFRVDRVWGWDCHGLPIENIAEQELGITHKKEIEELGVAKFNDICRSKVLSYVDEWEKIIPRLGRWVDMKNAYRTMDLPYMESVWWVFKQLWDKDLIYEGYRSMHICPRCETTLSQSEVTEGYKTIKDLSVIAEFELADEPGTFVLAWTTTPWTLIANAALAVGEDIEYVKIAKKDEGAGELVRFILAKDRLKEIFKEDEYSIIDTFKGDKLVGKSYKPLFEDYAQNDKIENYDNGWKIYEASFVTTEEGTGVVHVAPAFGEDDLNLGKEKKLPFIQHIGMDGIIKAEVKKFAGLPVKNPDDIQSTDVEIIKDLASRNLLFSKEKYEHSYPHCWRCETPLLNYATSSWFVKVSKVKPELLNLAKEINWSPKHIKEGRFGNWLEGARDWSISRQRYWASVIPIWRCSAESGGCGEMAVFGSVDELRKLSNQKITKITFVRHSESGKNVLDISSDSLNKFPLTTKGINQAEQSAEKLKNIDIIISSPILRTKETAEIINKKLQAELIFDERISEIKFGSWNDTSRENRLKNNKSYQEYKALANLEDRFNFKFGETGENRQDVVDRIENFVKEISKKYAGKNILIVGHGCTIASLNALLNHGNLKEFYELEDFAHNGMQTFYLDESGNAFDLHKDKVDHITIKCASCGKEAKRVADVLDTWFDSGSMPYAQIHYPFENEEKFEEYFPANFIAEAQDQTRAWFYYLHLLGTTVEDSIAFKNVIVSGIVLAEDGKKMAKRLKNYPDPVEVLNKYGADPLRFYLLSSQILQAENLNFTEKDLDQICKGFFRMLWNSYSFFTLYANIDNFTPSGSSEKSDNILDQWILSELNQLIKEVDSLMGKYELTKATRLLLPFVDNLSNWYIRRSRKRFQKKGDLADKNNAYQTLYTVLVEFSKVLAPFMPFIAEEIHKNLTGKESVHLEDFPVADETLINQDINQKMILTRSIIEQGLAKRSLLGNKFKVRQPLGYLKYGKSFKKLDDKFEMIIKEEVNVKDIIFDSNSDSVILDTEITAELQQEGQKNDIMRAIQDLRKKAAYSPDDLAVLFYEGAEEMSEIIKHFDSEIKLETKLSEIHAKRGEVDQDIELKLKDKNLWLGVKK